MSELTLTPKQQEAVTAATSNQRCLITGGAGSGKTTVIRNIIRKLEQQGETNIVLCAPTGKAAARITEASGYKAHTVHSACGLFPVEGTNEIGHLPSIPPATTATTLLIDEASMLADDLLAAVCRKVSPRCRVVLVGDPNQLPPVGAGYPFRDLINSKKVPHVHLDVCHRQNGNLLKNCYAVLEGKAEGLVADPGKGNRRDADWVFTQCSDEAICPTIEKLFSAGVCEDTFGIPAEELLVLTPLNKGEAGRVQLNRVVQKAYHSTRGRAVPEYKTEGERDQFVVGDRVLWTKNTRVTGLVNGDVGTVRAVGKDTCVVDFDGVGQRTVEQGINLLLGWVLTCHKAQGSQYAKVLVIQAERHCNRHLGKIVNRSWLYTSATRSKLATIFLGSAAAFRKHIATPALDTRKTYLSTLV